MASEETRSGSKTLEDACAEKANDTSLLEGFNLNISYDHTEYFDLANISECNEIQSKDIHKQTKPVNITEHEQILDTDLCTNGDYVLTVNRQVLNKEAIDYEQCERGVEGNGADNDECQGDDGASTCDSHHDLHVNAYKSDTSISLESANNLAGQISHTESAFKAVTFCDCELPSSTVTHLINEHCSSPSEGVSQERNQVIQDLLEIRNDLKDLSCDIDDHVLLKTRDGHKVKNFSNGIDGQDIVEIRNNQTYVGCDMDLHCGTHVVPDISEIRNDQEVKDFGCDIDDHNLLETRNNVKEQNLAKIRSDLKDLSCDSEDDCFGLVWLFNNATQETTEQTGKDIYNFSGYLAMVHIVMANNVVLQHFCMGIMLWSFANFE